MEPGFVPVLFFCSIAACVLLYRCSDIWPLLPAGIMECRVFSAAPQFPHVRICRFAGSYLPHSTTNARRPAPMAAESPQAVPAAEDLQRTAGPPPGSIAIARLPVPSSRFSKIYS